jgi:Fe-S-cluster containining protein
MSEANPIRKKSRYRKSEIRERIKRRLLEICRNCVDGTCCFGGVDVDLAEALRISQLQLDIKKPWFEYLHRDPNVPSGWALETVVRNGSCVFHRPDRRCSIYDIRPHYCAEYPFEDGELAKNYQEYCCEADKTIIEQYKREVWHAGKRDR